MASPAPTKGIISQHCIIANTALEVRSECHRLRADLSPIERSDGGFAHPRDLQDLDTILHISDLPHMFDAPCLPSTTSEVAELMRRRTFPPHPERHHAT